VCAVAGHGNQYLRLLDEVVGRTARLVALWQTVGFVHGVLNTDNMSILGETIDYGPYGFLERFDPNYTPNTTDLPVRLLRWLFLQLRGRGRCVPRSCCVCHP
jgi:serine/tyrosine/threonine adenylyltransferase